MIDKKITRVIGLNIQIDKELLTILPHVKIGINHYTKITVSESPQMLKGRLQLFQEQLYFELDTKPLTEFANIQEWRAVWKALGADPNRYRPSVESLFRRIKKQEFLQSVHTAVDLNTFFSLQYEIPIGIYDLAKIVGDIQLTQGNEDDSYDGLNGRPNSLNRFLLLKDDYSPFGSPYVDSVRTAVTAETTEAIQIFFIRPSMDPTEALHLLQASGKMFTSMSGGEAESFVLHASQTSIALENDQA